MLAPDWQNVAAWLAVIFFAASFSYLASLLSMQLARRAGMIVQPGLRQSHLVATPTGGGLGLILSLITSALLIQIFMPLPMFWWQNMLPGVLVLAIVGWLDDRQPVSTLMRLLVQVAVSMWLLNFSCFGDSLSSAAV